MVAADLRICEKLPVHWAEVIVVDSDTTWQPQSILEQWDSETGPPQKTASRTKPGR
jgi:hypothetical protein